MSAKNSSFDKPDVIYEYDSEAEGHMDEDITISYDVSIYLIWKVVLSSAPCYECVVVTLYGHAQQLASCKCNNKKWTHIYIIL